MTDDGDERLKLPDRLRLPLAFDPSGLTADLERLPEDAWTRHFVPENYTGDWDILPLRAPSGALHPILRIVSNPGTSGWEDTEFLQASGYFKKVLASFACPLNAVRLMRLGGGSQILEHSDPDLTPESGTVRLHIPILTSAEVSFLVNRRPAAMAPGECWYLRLSDPHSVINRGTTPRVHLVIDATVNDWLAGMLATAANRSA